MSLTVRSVQERLRHWRAELVKLSQSQLCEEVNRFLEGDEKVSVSTISNYERSTEPRASFLAALKSVYPDLSLDWLVAGLGEPTSSNEELSRQQRDSLFQVLGRVFKQTRIDTLPVAARTALLSFYSEAQSRPSAYRSPEVLARLSSEVESLLFAPFTASTYFRSREELSADALTTYTVLFLTALRPLVRLEPKQIDRVQPLGLSPD